MCSEQLNLLKSPNIGWHKSKIFIKTHIDEGFSGRLIVVSMNKWEVILSWSFLCFRYPFCWCCKALLWRLKFIAYTQDPLLALWSRTTVVCTFAVSMKLWHFVHFLLLLFMSWGGDSKWKHSEILYVMGWTLRNSKKKNTCLPKVLCILQSFIQLC